MKLKKEIEYIEISLGESHDDTPNEYMVIEQNGVRGILYIATGEIVSLKLQKKYNINYIYESFLIGNKYGWYYMASSIIDGEKKVGVIDIKNNLIIGGWFDEIKDIFGNNGKLYFTFEKKGNCGMYDLDNKKVIGKTLSSFSYDFITNYDKHYIIGHDLTGLMCIIEIEKGNILLEGEFEEIIETNIGGYFYVRNSEGQAIFSVEGLKIIGGYFDDVSPSLYEKDGDILANVEKDGEKTALNLLTGNYILGNVSKKINNKSNYDSLRRCNSFSNGCKCYECLPDRDSRCSYCQNNY